MKVAILLQGHMKTWEKTKMSFMDTFGKYNPDIYIDTYYEQFWRTDKKVMTHEEIKHSFKDLNVKKLNVEYTQDVKDKIKDEAKKYHIPGTDWNLWLNTYAQMYKMKQVAHLCKQSGETYDIIIKPRFELTYPKEIDLNKYVGKPDLFISNKHCYCEYFVMGKPNLMYTFCNALDIIPRQYEHNLPGLVGMTSHTIMYYICIMNHIQRRQIIQVTKCIS